MGLLGGGGLKGIVVWEMGRGGVVMGWLVCGGAVCVMIRGRGKVELRVRVRKRVYVRV